MPTPSIFPMFLKAKGGGEGTIFIETLELEFVDPIEVEVLDDPVEIELLEVIELVVVDDPIEVEID